MIKIYSHQLQTIRSAISATIGEHSAIDDVVKFLHDNSVDEIGYNDTTYKELSNLFMSAFTHDVSDNHTSKFFEIGYIAFLMKLASEDIYEAIVTSYLNYVVLCKVKGKTVKINNKITLSFIKDAFNQIDKSTAHEPEMFFNVFSSFYDVCVEENFEENLDDDDLKFCEDDKAWDHFRLLSLSCLHLLVAASVPRTSDDIVFDGRSGFLSMLTKQFIELNKTTEYFANTTSSIIGVVEHKSLLLPSLQLLEEGDLCPDHVVLFDKDTPMAEVFYNDLQEEHNSYRSDGRVSYLLVNGYVVPCLTDEIRAECTTLTLAEMS